MKVILEKDVAGLGHRGDVKEVSEGYARNFLFRQSLALPATVAALDKLQKERLEHDRKISKEHERFVALKKKLENKTLKVKAHGEKNNLFAAIHEKDIAKAIEEQFGVEISAAQIKLNNQVKAFGTHELQIQFAKGLGALVKLIVEKD